MRQAVNMYPTSSMFTTDLHAEFARQTDGLMRRRFQLFTATMGVFAVVMLAARAFSPMLPDPIGSAVRSMMPSGGRLLAYVGLSACWALMYIGAFIHATRRPPTSATTLLLTAILLFSDGVLGVVLRAAGLPAGGGMFFRTFFMMTHVIACILLPLTPRQAMWPVLGVVVLSALSRLFIEAGSLPEKITAIVASPLVGVPGVAIAWFRHTRRLGRFRLQFFSDRYGEMRRELVDARRLHESLFPGRTSAGEVHVEYRYEPMRLIGGDFLYVHRTPADDGVGLVTNVVLLDVTGHGIPAALTVNRLHGELERIYAEDPGAGPGHTLRLLNRYVNLTLAHHSVYVTALCLKVDPLRSEVAFASGGHPPAFLRAVDGTIDEMHSTAIVLGAAPDSEFEAAPEVRRFGPGDSIIAYTDGAIECRDGNGRMLKVAGIQRLVAQPSAPAAGQWADTLLDAVARHRAGPPADDTLIVEIHRPLRTDPTQRSAREHRRGADGAPADIAGQALGAGVA